MTYWHIYIPLSNTSIRVKFYFSFILPYLLFMEFLSVKKTDIYFSEIEWGANDVSF